MALKKLPWVPHGISSGHISTPRYQFNSIHERLIALWKELTPYIRSRRVDFCSMDDAEDWTTATYLADTAQQAGLASSIFRIEEIGWDGAWVLSTLPASRRFLQSGHFTC
jgi:glutathionylspermidine synthase